MEEKYRKNRILFIFLIVLGLGSIFGSFGLLTIVEGWNAVAIVSFVGLMILIIGISGLFLNRRDYKKDLQSTSRAEKRLSDIEIERMVDEASVIYIEKYEKEKSIEFDFKYILVLDVPKNAICMISKTSIEKEESVLQCPNCQNYYLSKYLLGWLNKYDNCPICKTVLKTKKV